VLDRSTAHGQATLGSRRRRLPEDLVDCGVELLPDQIAPFLGIEFRGDTCRRDPRCVNIKTNRI
jgi:hypothetical protein